jgi:hypothetical protein
MSEMSDQTKPNPAQIIEDYLDQIQTWMMEMFEIVGHEPAEAESLTDEMISIISQLGTTNVLAVQAEKKEEMPEVTDDNWQEVLADLSESVTDKEVMESFAFAAGMVMKGYNEQVFPALNQEQKTNMKTHYQKLQKLIS